jgi:hypothetical protein
VCERESVCVCVRERERERERAKERKKEARRRGEGWRDGGSDRIRMAERGGERQVLWCEILPAEGGSLSNMFSSLDEVR